MHLPESIRNGIIQAAPKWWNWQTRCVQGAVPYGCAGSNPAFGTKIFRPTAPPPRWGDLVTGAIRFGRLRLPQGRLEESCGRSTIYGTRISLFHAARIISCAPASDTRPVFTIKW